MKHITPRRLRPDLEQSLSSEEQHALWKMWLNATDAAFLYAQQGQLHSARNRARRCREFLAAFCEVPA